MTDKYIRKNRIREALSLRGMRQVELCEKTGIKKASVNGWINQRWQPKQDALFKMSKALEVSEMWLAGYDVPMENKPVERPDFIVEHDNHTYYIELKNKDIDCNKIKHLLNCMLELNPDQIDTIEQLVNQLHKINDKD